MAARKQFLLRMDAELWADVEKWAADELRSVNAQVEYLLREAVRKRRGGRGGDGGRPPSTPGPWPPEMRARQACYVLPRVRTRCPSSSTPSCCLARGFLSTSTRPRPKASTCPQRPGMSSNSSRPMP